MNNGVSMTREELLQTFDRCRPCGDDVGLNDVIIKSSSETCVCPGFPRVVVFHARTMYPCGLGR